MLFLLILLRKKCSNPETCPDSCYGPLDVRAHVTLKPYLPNRSLLSIRRYLRFDPHYLGRLCVNKIFILSFIHIPQAQNQIWQIPQESKRYIRRLLGRSVQPWSQSNRLHPIVVPLYDFIREGKWFDVIAAATVMSGRPANRLGETWLHWGGS